MLIIKTKYAFTYWVFYAATNIPHFYFKAHGSVFSFALNKLEEQISSGKRG